MHKYFVAPNPSVKRFDKDFGTVYLDNVFLIASSKISKHGMWPHQKIHNHRLGVDVKTKSISERSQSDKSWLQRSTTKPCMLLFEATETYTCATCSAPLKSLHWARKRATKTSIEQGLAGCFLVPVRYIQQSWKSTIPLKAKFHAKCQTSF